MAARQGAAGINRERDNVHTDLCDVFGIEYPIFAFSHCRDVVAAVSRFLLPRDELALLRGDTLGALG